MGLVQPDVQTSLRRAQLAGVRLLEPDRIRVLLVEPPHTIQEPRDAGDEVVVPVHALFRRRGEEHPQPCHVRARLPDKLADPDADVLGRRHRLAVQADHALGMQGPAWLLYFHHSHVGERAGEEPEEYQVAGGVLDAADVLVNRQPLIRFGLAERQLVVPRVGVAQVIPRRVHERVHRVRVAPRRPAAFRAGRVDERLHALEHRLTLGLVVLHVFRQQHRQLVFGHRHDAALRTVNHRNRCAPVPLARDQPVLQTVIDHPPADALLLQERRDLLDALVRPRPVELPRVHHRSHIRVGFGQLIRTSNFGLRTFDNDLDRNLVLAGELEVTLVVSRHCHHHAGSVRRQHEVGDVNRNPVARQRVDRIPAGEDAFLVGRGRDALDFRPHHHPAAELAHRRFLRQPLRNSCGQRRVRRERHGSHAVERVRPSREHRYLLAHALRRFLSGAALCNLRNLWILYSVTPVPGHLRNLRFSARSQREVDLDALRPSNPVPLHRPDVLRPAVEHVDTVQQLLGVVGNAEEPLRQLPLHDGRAAPVAEPVVHLLVGQHGLALRAPVHRRFLPVRESALVELDEQPLVPAVILGHARRHLAVPVVADAQQFQALPRGLYRFEGPIARVIAMGDGRVLRGQAERVPAERVQHVVALHLPEPTEHVADDVVPAVAHVYVP